MSYLMFKWTAAPVRSQPGLAARVVRSATPGTGGGGEGYRTEVLVQGPTGWLGRLQVHLTQLDPGGGYEPHADAHDVAIVPLSGVIETAGESVEPHAAVFFPAGSLHGMRNGGPETARYLVIELHAPPGRLRRAAGMIRRALRQLRGGASAANAISSSQGSGMSVITMPSSARCIPADMGISSRRARSPFTTPHTVISGS